MMPPDTTDIYQALSHTCFLHPPQVMTRSNKAAHTDTPYRNNPLKEAEKTERLASKTHTDTSGNPLEEPSSST